MTLRRDAYPCALRFTASQRAAIRIPSRTPTALALPWANNRLQTLVIAWLFFLFFLACAAACGSPFLNPRFGTPRAYSSVSTSPPSASAAPSGLPAPTSGLPEDYQSAPATRSDPPGVRTLIADPRAAAGPDSFAPNNYQIAQTVNLPHQAVVRVIAPENGAVSYGSGTLVDVRDRYGLVITNWHVVRDAQDTIEVVFPDGFRSSARALKVDPNWDLAALVIWRPRATPAKLADHAPRPGDTLTIAGYGRGAYRSVTGRCTQYVAPGAEFPFEMVEINVEARQGDSGGPIFNDRGELAGVLFGAGRGTTSGSYCGRVGGFLASLAPDLKPGENATDQRLASQSQPPGPSSDPANTAPLGRYAGAASNPEDQDSQSAWRAKTPYAEDSQPVIELADNPPPRRPAANPRQIDSPSRSSAPRAAEQEPAALAALSASPINAAEPSPSDAVNAGDGGDYATEPNIDTPPADASTVSSEPPGALSWQDLVGDTLFEQIKSALACIGAVVVLWYVFRFVG